MPGGRIPASCGADRSLDSLFRLVASINIDDEDIRLSHKQVNDFFKKTSDLAAANPDPISLIGAGLAYERMDCLRKDMLNFYENILSKIDSESNLIQCAQERWLYTKKKHSTTERTKNKKVALRELEEKRREWGIEELPTGRA